MNITNNIITPNKNRKYLNKNLVAKNNPREVKYNHYLSCDMVTFKGNKHRDMDQNLKALACIDEIESEDKDEAKNGLNKLILTLQDSDVFFNDDLKMILEYITKKQKHCVDQDILELYQEIVRIIKYDYKID